MIRSYAWRENDDRSVGFSLQVHLREEQMEAVKFGASEDPLHGADDAYGTQQWLAAGRR
jgi:hypothetical protein